MEMGFNFGKARIFAENEKPIRLKPFGREINNRQNR